MIPAEKISERPSKARSLKPFRSHVVDGSNHVPSAGQAALLFSPGGDSKIQQLGHSVRCNNHIRRFHVTMNHVIAMGIGQRGAYLLDDPQSESQRKRTADWITRSKASPATLLHHNVRKAFLFAQIVDRDNVWMLQHAGLGRLAIEALQHLRVPGETFSNSFNRHFAAQMFIEGPID